MAKKDFSKVNTGRVYDAITEATAEPAQEVQETQGTRKPRKEYTAQEAQEFLATGKTSGHKGVKLPRINLAFNQPVYDYVQTMSRVRGENMTEFVNLVLQQHMEEHKDVYARAIEFKNSL